MFYLVNMAHLGALRTLAYGCEHREGVDGKVRFIKQGQHLINLLIGDQPCAYRFLSNLLEVRLSQSRTGRSAFPNGYIAVHAHINQSMRLETPVQTPRAMSSSCKAMRAIVCYRTPLN